MSFRFLALLFCVTPWQLDRQSAGFRMLEAMLSKFCYLYSYKLLYLIMIIPLPETAAQGIRNVKLSNIQILLALYSVILCLFRNSYNISLNYNVRNRLCIYLSIACFFNFKLWKCRLGCDYDAIISRADTL